MNDTSKLRPLLLIPLLILVAVGGFFFVKRLLYARHMIQEQKALKSGHYLSAIKLYRMELENNPGNFDRGKA